VGYRLKCAGDKLGYIMKPAIQIAQMVILPMCVSEELFGTPELLVELGQNMIEMPDAIAAL